MQRDLRGTGLINGRGGNAAPVKEAKKNEHQHGNPRRNRLPPRRLLMKSAILWRISRLFSWAVSTSSRAAETGDTGQAVEAACQPA
ncbi:TPA: hypothetical protein GF098_24490 [Escherichia coli]|nr:hypothetical protein [Escherichia coli]